MHESTLAIEKVSEQRRVTRYSTRARVAFRWKAPGEGTLFAKGRTRDISLAGAFVWAPQCPLVDSMLEMEITLPWRNPDSQYVIQAWMMVVRVEERLLGMRQKGFAAVGGAFSLQEVATIKAIAGRGTTTRLGADWARDRLAQAS